MIKAIFFDVDGTLFSFKTHTMPQSTINSLHELRKKGIKLFVASGRHKYELDPVREVFEFDAYLSLNGQYCFDAEGNTLHKAFVDREDVEIAVAESKKNIFPFCFVHENGQYMNMHNDTVEKLCKQVDLKMPPVVDPETALNQEIFQFVAYLKKDEEEAFLSKLNHVESARWHGDFLDIIPKGGGKHTGIKKILEHYGLTFADAMAFGDGGNDVSMLMAVNIGIAMGNAGEAVKLAADYVTAHIDDDGIEKALKYFSLLD